VPFFDLYGFQKRFVFASVCVFRARARFFGNACLPVAFLIRTAAKSDAARIAGGFKLQQSMYMHFSEIPQIEKASVSEYTGILKFACFV